MKTLVERAYELGTKKHDPNQIVYKYVSIETAKKIWKITASNFLHA